MLIVTVALPAFAGSSLPTQISQ